MSTLLFFQPAHLEAPDRDFQLGLYLSSDQAISGLDYGLSLTSCVLLSRDTVGSSFPDTIDNSLLGDLGASVEDVRVPASPGLHFVASYHFRVNGSATAALVKPVPYPNTVGYVGIAPDFVEKPFDSFGGSSISVPEPGVWIGLLLTALLARFRKSS